MLFSIVIGCNFAIGYHNANGNPPSLWCWGRLLPPPFVLRHIVIAVSVLIVPIPLWTNAGDVRADSPVPIAKREVGRILGLFAVLLGVLPCMDPVDPVAKRVLAGVVLVSAIGTNILYFFLVLFSCPDESIWNILS